MKTKNPKDLTRALEKRIKEVNNIRLSVGVPKEEIGYTRPEKVDKNIKTGESLDQAIKRITQPKAPESYFLADIAFENNFGSISKGIPARPFGSTTVPRYKDKIQRVFKTWVRDALEGRIEVQDAYDRIGFTVAGYMKKNLTHGEWQPNAPLTIEKKGSDQPLIDQGQLRQSITWLTRGKNDE
jgi:hypothetical protein